MNCDHNKKIRLLKFQSAYGKFNLNSPKGYSLKVTNAQTDHFVVVLFTYSFFSWEGIFLYKMVPRLLLLFYKYILIYLLYLKGMFIKFNRLNTSMKKKYVSI